MSDYSDGCFGDQREDNNETVELTDTELDEAIEIMEWAAVAAMIEAGLFP